MWLIPAMAVRANPPRIIVVDSLHDGPPNPGRARLTAELSAAGFEVLERPWREASAPTPEALSELTREEGAVAGVFLQTADEGRPAHIWIMDRMTGKLVIRELAPEDGQSSISAEAELMAVEAVELLRASLEELDLQGDAPHGEVTLPMREVDRLRSDSGAPESPKSPLARDRWRTPLRGHLGGATLVRIHPTLLTPVTSLGIDGAAHLGRRGWLRIGGALVVPVVPATADLPAARIRVDIATLAARVGAEIPTGTRVMPMLGVGGGPMLAWAWLADGDGRDVTLTAWVEGWIGVGIRLSESIRLDIMGAAGAAFPSLRIADGSGGWRDAGPPMIDAGVGLSWTPR
jgi:hypothetical protein